MTKVFCASDHGGYKLKQDILKFFPNWVNLGCDSEDSVDYPNYAKVVCEEVESNLGSRGVLICGTGIGMSIAANRFLGVRAMVGTSNDFVNLARRHNDINILCLPGRFITSSEAIILINTFLTTPFDGNRHAKRLDIFG